MKKKQFIIKDGILAGYNGVGGDVIIPDGVTSIGDSAFSGCIGLTSVTIGKGVIDVGTGVFRGCKNLKTVIISENNPFKSKLAEKILESLN